MMFKFFALTFIYLLGFSVFSNAQNISSNTKKDIAIEVKMIIYEILKEEKIYQKLDNKILKYNKKIIQNQILLDDMNEKNNLLEKEFFELQKEQNEIESTIITLTVKKYSKSMAIKYADKKSSKSIVDNEVYVVLHNSIKKEVEKYNKISEVLKDKISIKLDLINKLNTFKKEHENLISVNVNLKIEREKKLKVLREKHKLYIMKLESLNKDQKKMKNLLIDLSLVKKNTKNKNIKQTNITPSSKGFKAKITDISKESTNVAMSRYNGAKTISPLKKYTIINKFGIYYDPIYDTELFNKSISLKTTTKNAQVRSILDGEILFIKRDDSRFKNIVIVKYDDGLNAIYSNMDEVSTTVSVGMNVTQGFTLGKVNKILIFQTTKNNKYIDPEKLFR